MDEIKKRADKCCVVTGATGWLGRHIVQELDKLASGIFILLRRKNGLSVGERCEGLGQQTGAKSKLLPLEIIDNRLPGIPPETTHIIHCAAMVDFSDNHTIFQANVGLTWDILAAAAQLKHLERILYLSTFSFRGNSKEPFTEHSLDGGQDFVTAYNLTKFLAETTVRKFHKDVKASIIRLGSILGRADGYFPIPSDWFYRTVKLWLDGKCKAFPLGMDQRIQPLPVDVTARVLCDLLYYPLLPEVLHLPPSPGPEMQAIFQEMASALGKPAPKLYSQHSREWEAYRMQLSPTVRRIMDGLYPPPPDGEALATVNSDYSKTWFVNNKIDVPEIAPAYWRRLAQYINDTCKGKKP